MIETKNEKNMYIGERFAELLFEKKRKRILSLLLQALNLKFVLFNNVAFLSP